MTYHASQFSSSDTDEIGALLATRTSSFVLRGASRYRERMSGDDLFSVGRHSTALDVSLQFAPAQIYVGRARGQSPWSSGSKNGNLGTAAVLFEPDQELQLTHAAGTRAYSVTLERNHFQSLCRAYFGPDVRIRLRAGEPLPNKVGKVWDELVRLIDLSPLQAPLVRVNAYRSLAFGVMEFFGDTAGSETRTTAVARRSHVFKTATDYLDAHCHLPIGVDGASLAAGISVRELRRLFLGYARNGQTPEQYLRAQRLAGARRELLQGLPPGTHLKTFAARWGFAAPGAFVRRYLDQYHQLPPWPTRADRQQPPDE